MEVKEQSVNTKQKDSEQLFGSIKNNIEDVSNSLPAKKKESTMIPVQNIDVPAVNVIEQNKGFENNMKPVTETLKTPVIHKDGVSPVILQKQVPAQEYTTPIEHVEPRTPVDTSVPKNHVPRYDWNLKNIYLEKIGLSNLY